MLFQWGSLEIWRVVFILHQTLLHSMEYCLKKKLFRSDEKRLNMWSEALGTCMSVSCEQERGTGRIKQKRRDKKKKKQPRDQTKTNMLCSWTDVPFSLRVEAVDLSSPFSLMPIHSASPSTGDKISMD